MKNISRETIIIGFFILLLCFLFYKNFCKTNNFENTKLKVFNFNTTWCGYSKQYQPVWNAFVDSLKDSDNIEVIDAKCDDNKYSELLKKYDVEGFPTVVIVDNKGFKKYEGPRTVNGLRKELGLSQMDSDIVAANTNPGKCGGQKKQVKFVDEVENKIKLYNFNTKWCGYSVRFQPIWNELTTQNTNKNVEIIDVKCDDPANKELCSKYDIPGFPSVLKVNKNGPEMYDGPRTVEGLMDFANN